MEITILAFGQIAEITGKSSWTVTGVSDTDTLISQIEHDFPGTKNIKYRVAVNQQIISGATPLPEHATVALLPPFSGG